MELSEKSEVSTRFLTVRLAFDQTFAERSR